MTAPSQNNTIGVVRWEALTTETDGETIALLIPASFQAHHVPHLEAILRSRLSDFFDHDAVTITLEPGDESGTVALRGLTEPWPDALTLRSILDGAFAETGEMETRQLRRSDDLRMHLLGKSTPRVGAQMSGQDGTRRDGEPERLRALVEGEVSAQMGGSDAHEDNG